MEISAVHAILNDSYTPPIVVKDHAAGPLTQSPENAMLARALEPLFAQAANNSTFIQPHFTTLPPMF